MKSNEKLNKLQSARSSNNLRGSKTPEIFTFRKKTDRSTSFTNIKTSRGLYTARKQYFEEPISLPSKRPLEKMQHKFKFDFCYDENDTNIDVYDKTVKKVARASLDGINGTVFVYGQTGTGKTFTMMGQERTQIRPL